MTDTRAAPVEAPAAGTSGLLSASAVMAAGTLVSRLAGFARAALIALVLGNATRQVDMFTIANTVSNSIYILLAGGALNTVLVPQIVRAIHSDPDGGEAYTNRVMTAFLLIVAGVTVVATGASPAIIGLYSSGWRTPALAAHFHSMVLLGYLCLPQIFFYGAFFLLGQVLNARGRFGPMMLAPVVNNLVAIAVFVAYLLIWTDRNTSAPFTGEQILLLGLGATAGIVLQAAVLVPYLRATGFRYRPRFDFFRTGLGHTFSLAKWTLGFVVVTQAAVIVVAKLASRATTGGQGAGWAAYQNAYLLWIVPHSLITVSLSTAMLPAASRRAAAGDLAGVERETTRTMRLAVTALLPASVGLFVLARPVTAVVYGFGAGSGDAVYVGWALMAFALGLVPFTLQYVCLRGFYALEDTRTTFFLQVLIAALNIVLAVGITAAWSRPTLVATGLALAYAVAYACGMAVSFSRLRRHLPGLSSADLVRHCLRLVAAVLPAAAAAVAVDWATSARVSGYLGNLLGLIGGGLVAVALFLLAARALRIKEVNAILAVVWRRGSHANAEDFDDRTDDRPGAADPASTTRLPVPDEATTARLIVPDAAAAAPEPVAVAGSPDVFPGGSSGGEPDSAPTMPSDDPVTPGEQPWTSLDSESGQMSNVVTDPASTEELAPPRQAPSAAEPDAGTPKAETAGLESTGNETTGPQHAEVGEPEPPALRLPAGTVLAGRYRLEELLADAHPDGTGDSRGGSYPGGAPLTVTWRAFDQVLSRSVLCHLLAAGHPRQAELLEAARKAAAATDSRFLRVLDAVHSEDDQIGSYLVSEYTTGQSLRTVLASGPLSGLEAAWLVREVADALAGVHALGLYHQQINPDTVLITPSGNLKIAGLMIEQAVRPDAVDRGTETPERADVLDLGRLLYVALVSRWPGGPAFGLPAAPSDGRHWLTPRQVRAGVSPALDRICDQILSEPPRHHAPPLVTAAQVVEALTKVLGSADASGDLERRLRQPGIDLADTETFSAVPDVGDEQFTRPLAPLRSPAGRAARGRGANAAEGKSQDGKTQVRAGPPTTGIGRSQSTPRRPMPAASAPVAALRSGPAPVTARVSAGGGATAVGPGGSARPAALVPSVARGRRWIGLLAALVLLALLVVLAAAIGLHRTSGPNVKTSAGSPASTAAATPVAVPIRSARDFDPQGDDKTENPREVPLAYDHDPTTRWRTVNYFQPKLGNIKRGVGLVLDLGTATDVSAVKLQLSGNGTDLDIRVPKNDPAGVTSPPMTSDSKWRVVASRSGVGSSATVTVAPAVRTRFVLVYLTSLPKEGNGYRGGIYEVEVDR